MGSRSLTRDEVFLCTIAKIARKKGDLYSEVGIYEVGQAIGQNNRSVDNIVRMLAQANFVKKGEEGMIYLTPHGYSLIEELEREYT